MVKNKATSVGQGHGIEGRFAGLPDAYAEENRAHIVLVSVPFDKTSTYLKGSDKGPAALIEASRNLELYDIETDTEVYLNGIHTSAPIIEQTSEKMLDATYQKVKLYLEKGKYVVTIGGEHTIAFASIKAHAEHYKQLTILQFDAHADLQDTYENNPWSHACVMARVKEIPQIKNIFSIGIRSMSSDELPNLDRSHAFFSHQILENQYWMEDVLKLLEGPIYITFDLDVFDSSLMPSTGTPEPGGLKWNQTLKFLSKIIQEKNVVGFDIVELCPNSTNPAPDYLSAKLLYKILSYQFHYHPRQFK